MTPLVRHNQNGKQITSWQLKSWHVSGLRSLRRQNWDPTGPGTCSVNGWRCRETRTAVRFKPHTRWMDRSGFQELTLIQWSSSCQTEEEKNWFHLIWSLCLIVSLIVWFQPVFLYFHMEGCGDYRVSNICLWLLHLDPAAPNNLLQDDK